MKFPPNHFDYHRVRLLSDRISGYLQVNKVVKLKPGDVFGVKGRYGDRVNLRVDMERIVFGALVIREDGSGHGPPMLAEKVVSISKNGFG